MTTQEQVDLIDINEFQDILGVSRYGANKLIKENVIPIHSTEEFYKWGRWLEARYFDRKEVEKVAVNLSKKKSRTPTKRNTNSPAIDLSTRIQRLLFASAIPRSQILYFKLSDGKAFYQSPVRIGSTVFAKKKKSSSQVRHPKEKDIDKHFLFLKCKHIIHLPDNLIKRLSQQKMVIGKEREQWIGKIERHHAASQSRFEKAMRKCLKQWEKEAKKSLKDEYDINYNSYIEWLSSKRNTHEKYNAIYRGGNGYFMSSAWQDGITCEIEDIIPQYKTPVDKGFEGGLVSLLKDKLSECFLKPSVPVYFTSTLSAKISGEQIDKLSDGYYPSMFPLARNKKRRLIAYLGPTNSGKTYQAMEQLTKAKTGCYLAPLRLMAMENADRLNNEGIPCDMITGEERLLQDNAKHVSATIEMLDTSQEVEVAVIDEIQMLSDADRGWAWTQALIGVAADTVIMTGSPDALPMIKHIANMLDEEVEVIQCERKSPLSVLKKPRSIGKLLPGDAIIAFSRREIFELCVAVRAQGHSVALIYGNLSPEVRRKEAERFRTGDADILIATDAIGMGLNLPIRRILFYDYHKFDGRSVRKLHPSEIRQIGGRAGRYGINDEGFVTLLNFRNVSEHQKGMEHIRSAINYKQNWDKLASKGKKYPPYLMPPLEMILDIAERLKTNSLGRIMHFLDLFILNKKESGYQSVASRDNDKLFRYLDRTNLSLADKYKYLGCPFPFENKRPNCYITNWIDHHKDGNEIKLPDYKQKIQKLGTSDLDLLKCEMAIKELTAYLWLSQKFPEYYVHAQEALKEKSRLNVLVEGILKSNALKRACKKCGRAMKKKKETTICNKCYGARSQRPRRPKPVHDPDEYMYFDYDEFDYLEYDEDEFDNDDVDIAASTK